MPITLLNFRQYRNLHSPNPRLSLFSPTDKLISDDLPKKSFTFTSPPAIFNHMVEYSLDSVYMALSDGTRRAIIERLLQQGQQRIKDVAGAFDMSFAAVAKHIAVLEKAGVIKKLKVGREQHLLLEKPALAAAQQNLDFYCRFWAERFDALEEIVKDEVKAQRKT